MLDRLSPTTIGILIVLLLSVAGVLADYSLKVASTKHNATANGFFLAGAAIYALTAFGWVWAMPHLKLSQLGAFYSVSSVLLLTLVGVVFFKETLQVKEIIGIALGITSLILITE